MSQNLTEQILYDVENKIWKSINNPHKEFTQQSVGNAFLHCMRRKVNKSKILDYLYEDNIAKTAQEIYEQSITIAQNLKRLAIQENDVIVLFSDNNEWTSVLTMGTLLIGAQIMFFDVLMEDQYIDDILYKLQPAMICYEEISNVKLRESLQRLKLSSLKYLLTIDGSEDFNMKTELLAGESVNNFDKFKAVPIENSQTKICCLVLTSGSTGIPKIVQISHAAVLHAIMIGWPDSYTEETVLFSIAPLRWVSQILQLMISMILAVKRVSSNGSITPLHIKKLIQNCNVTHLYSTPTLFYNLLLESESNDRKTLRSLRTIMFGGEMPFSTLKTLLVQYVPQAEAHMVYGMTEFFGAIAIDAVVNGGKLRAGFELMILDENKSPMEYNCKGQLALKAPYPLLGYKGLDNAMECFILQDFFLNGDYGFVDNENNLHVLGRYKDLIKGQRATLIPSQVESSVIEIPEITAACLVGYRKSAKDLYDIAALFVVSRSNADWDENYLRIKILKKLQTSLTADELDCVKNIYMVDIITLTSCGKADRQALKKQALLMCNI